MRAAQIALMQENWRAVIAQQEAFGARFYERLFELAPEVKPLFKNDIHRQANMLVQALDLIVMSLDDLPGLMPIARTFALRHRDYGVKPLHYGLVGQALLLTLEEKLGAGFTGEARRAWSEAYAALSTAMIEAAY